MLNRRRLDDAFVAERPIANAPLRVGERLRGFTVLHSLPPSSQDVPEGMQDFLAVDAAGARVILRVPCSADAALRARAEAELARRHLHPAILQTVGVLQHRGAVVHIIEHASGPTLGALMARAGALDPGAVCRIGRDIAVALADLHRESGACHGALGADRIILEASGAARLLDLGRVRPLQHSRLFSPERRAAGGAPSAADDLYALGVTLLEAALGDVLEIDAGHLDARILAGAVPERLLDALTALVAPEQRRVHNARAVARMFESVEPRYGDGGLALREALERADGEDFEGPITLPDLLASSDAGIGDAGIADVEVARASAPGGDEPPFLAHERAFFEDELLPDVDVDTNGAGNAAEAPPPGRRRVGFAGVLLVALVVVTAVAAAGIGQLSIDQLDRPWLAREPAPPGAQIEATEPGPVAAAAVVPARVAAPAPVRPIAPAPVAPATMEDTAEAAETGLVAVRPSAPKVQAQRKPARVAAAPEVVPLGPAVRLIVDAPPALRARAEEKLRACNVTEGMLGSLQIVNRRIRSVTSEPQNACVGRVLQQTLGSYREDQPFELELR